MKLSYTFKLSLVLLAMTAVAMTTAFHVANMNITEDQTLATQAGLNTTASMLPEIKSYQVPTATVKSKNETAAKKEEEKEVACDFKKNLFQQLNYIVGRRTSCVYR